MNTQALQHALSQMLHSMQQQMMELTAAIAELEARLKGRTTQRGAEHQVTLKGAPANRCEQHAPVTEGHCGPKGGGRSSAGWSEAARAEVATRMRAYWRQWRANKAQAKGPAASEDAPRKEPGRPGTSRRSTAGWTPMAREQAAARMRARWRGQHQAPSTAKEKPWDSPTSTRRD